MLLVLQLCHHDGLAGDDDRDGSDGDDDVYGMVMGDDGDYIPCIFEHGPPSHRGSMGWLFVTNKSVPRTACAVNGWHQIPRT